MAEIDSIEVVSGVLEGTLDFARLTGLEEVSTPFRYELEMVHTDPQGAADALKVLGSELEIRVKVDTGRAGDVKTQVFHGLIDEFAVVGFSDHEIRYSAVVRPWLWLLSKSTDNKVFQNKSVIDIVEEVFGEYPQAKFESRLSGSYEPREYCVQYGETDLDFVQRLLEDEGIFYFFEHEEGQHSLILVDETAALKTHPDYETVQYQTGRGAGARHVEAIRSWERRARSLSGTYAHTDYDFEKPAADLAALSNQPKGHDGDGGELYAYPGRYIEHARGDTLAQIRVHEAQALFQTVEARADTVGLKPGAKFSLTDHPLDAEDGDYAVLSAEYAIANGQFDQDAGTPGRTFGLRLTLIPAGASFRPARITPKPVMKGPQTAVVVGPSGEEIYTDQYSRVKIQFHWDRLGKKDEESSCFVRVSSVWAGSGWGFIQIPRIGQEVIVDFLEGDPDQPIITGRVYNAAQMPPYELPANATQSGWKSNSSPGGGGWNELRFEDKKGEEEVYFQAEKDHNELVKNNETRTIGNDWVEDVGHDATQTVGNDRTELVVNNKSTTVEQNREVTIGVDDTESVGNNRSLSVGVNETISVGANSDETIGANHSQTVGSNQTLSVGSARVRTVGAAETVTIGAAQAIVVGGARHLTIGAADNTVIAENQGLTVGDNQSTTVASDQSLTVGKSQATEVGENRAIKVGKSNALEAGEDIAVKAGKQIVIEAGDAIILKTGSAAITMKKDGTITIEGKDVTVKGSGKINVKASKDVTIKGSKINQN